MRVFFFTKYDQTGASSRYRTYQYLDYYKKANIDCIVYPLLKKPYLKNIYKEKPSLAFNIIYTLKAYVLRLLQLVRISRKDIVFIEYELFPYFPATFERWLKFRGIKYIVDYDDAIFHNYDQHKNKLINGLLKNKIPRVIKNAEQVITGSPYLTSFAKRLSKKVTEIPTSINLERYQIDTNAKDQKGTDKFIVGWIGSKSTSRHFITIVPALKKFAETHDYELRLIGFDIGLEKELKGLPYKIIQWKKETEVPNIASFHVGIMPLGKSLFDKGKCGFKLIQYMACGVMTISTPVEANKKIDRLGCNFFADSQKEWEECLEEAYEGNADNNELSEKNKSVVEDYYSIQANHLNYLEIFKEISQNDSSVKTISENNNLGY